jgi:hypothetical protein
VSRSGLVARRPEYAGDPLRTLWQRLRTPDRRAGALARRAAASPWFWLALGTGVTFVLALIYVFWIGTFFVMSDEMTYMKGAIHVWDHKRPLTQSDVFYASVSQLPEMLRAPALLLGNLPAAWDTMRVINLVAFMTSSVPAYLIARQIIPWRREAVLASLICVFVPWLAITGSLLTEGLAYPAFMWAMAGAFYGLMRPGWRSDLLAIAACGLAALTRSQLMVLLPVYLAAVAVHHLGWALANPSAWRTIVPDAARRHVLLLAGLAAFVAYVATRGTGHVQSLLGNYSVTTHGDLLPPGTLDSARELMSLVALGVAGLPFALATAYVLTTLWRPETRERHAFAALVVCAVAGVVTVAASFTIRFSGGAGLSERYACYIAPLLVLSAFAVMTPLRRRMAVPLLAASAVTWWTFAGVPRLVESANIFAPTAPFHKILNSALGAVGSRLPWHWQPVEVAAAIVIVATLALAVPRRLIGPRLVAGALGSVIALAIAGQTLYALYVIGWPQHKVGESYLATRDWVDKSVGWHTKVAGIIGEADEAGRSQGVWWEAQFWNRAVDQTYLPEGSDNFDQDRYRVISVDHRTGVVSGMQAERYTLSSSISQKFRLVGARPIRSVGSLTLERLPGPPRAIWSLDGTDGVGRMAAGTAASYRRYRPEAPLAITVSLPAPEAGQRPKPATVRVRAGDFARSVRLAPGTAPVTVRVPGRPRLVRVASGQGGATVKLTLVGDPTL